VTAWDSDVSCGALAYAELAISIGPVWFLQPVVDMAIRVVAGSAWSNQSIGEMLGLDVHALGMHHCAYENDTQHRQRTPRAGRKAHGGVGKDRPCPYGSPGTHFQGEREAPGSAWRYREIVDPDPQTAIFEDSVILVDTSVWVDHFRDGNPRLTELLKNQGVLIHPFVVGELSLGLLKNRA
jgi:hypothetical protein